MSWPEAGGKTLGILGYLELCWLSPVTGGANGQKEADRRKLLYKVFFFVVMVGFVHLSICIIQSGEHSHGFWSGSRECRGWPSPPPDTDTFKRSRATRTEHDSGKGVPPREQDGPSPLGLSRRTPPPSWGQEEHLCSLPGGKGRAIGIGTREGNIYLDQGDSPLGSQSDSPGLPVQASSAG